MAALVGEPPFEAEVALPALGGVLGDDRHEQRAIADLLADLLVPHITAAQLALIEPYLDTVGVRLCYALNAPHQPAEAGDFAAVAPYFSGWRALLTGSAKCTATYLPMSRPIAVPTRVDER